MLVEWVDQQRHTIRTHRKMNANFQNFRKLFLFYFYLDSFNHLETKSRFQISTIVNFVHWNIWTIWIITFHDTNTISSTKQILSRHNFQQQYQNNMSILKKTLISKNQSKAKWIRRCDATNGSGENSIRIYKMLRSYVINLQNKDLTYIYV